MYWKCVCIRSRYDNCFLFPFFYSASQWLFIITNFFPHFISLRLRSDSNFGRVHHLALILCSLVSLTIFDTEFKSWISVPVSLANLACLVLVPTHITPDEEKLLDTATDSTESTVGLLQGVWINNSTLSRIVCRRIGCVIIPQGRNSRPDSPWSANGWSMI